MYHYTVVQVTAKQPFQRLFTNHYIVALLIKVMAYSICWLSVSQTYLSTLFSCQRTVGIDLPIKNHNSLWAFIDK
ncbi:Putative extrachromosomal origin protein [Clostridioides difficile E28]|uniref:Extrachromosomal origin protein n=1 Tax=Clostridioides difficile (strain 630) TaxID=272563 RepID=F3Y5Z5_CLOD6|nr:putative extrachromosomal origin protein [Clostridioides difficile 630]CCL12076.1 Putative extrachromosomal origin protein [Clostridioides difficile E16]CCL14542.1 Putative extrachromosomal origin protein [Clostridioides difficile T22]CCL18620.1 Putative extrachromosomal origin protein [Clostridioides difficile E25]CCL22537.1 Putative extrachromosomal origin protein [Clostridioides difficile T15]CCL49629.1 Putative extrachromosomal origin protein [Clostridioides difficile T6]CCL57705.1 Put